jgi:hypothetical protein
MLTQSRAGVARAHLERKRELEVLQRLIRDSILQHRDREILREVEEEAQAWRRERKAAVSELRRLIEPSLGEFCKGRGFNGGGQPYSPLEGKRPDGAWHSIIHSTRDEKMARAKGKRGAAKPGSSVTDLDPGDTIANA